MMKKFSIITAVFISALILMSGSSTKSQPITKPQYEHIHKPPEGSMKELYQDTILTTLHPYIEKSLENHYGSKISYAPYVSDIISITRPNGYRTFEFIVKIQAMPYIGPHISVGVDQITIRINTDKIKVEKFEHLETHELPNYLR